MRTPDSPSIIARAQARRASQLLEGTLLSFTTISHPPKGFKEHARLIGLIELSNGEHVLGALISHSGIEPQIGQVVVPRMRLSRVSEQGLRIYDPTYELTTQVRTLSKEEEKFCPGYILALTGPSGVGKSTVSRLLTHMLCDFTAKVPIVTSREPKEGDENEYQYIGVKEFERLKRAGDIVAWTRIPSDTEERYYGYRASAITAIWDDGKIPVVITEMHLLQGLANHYGRRSLLSFGLLPPGQSKRAMLSQLLHRMRKRGRETEEQMQERLANAKTDLAFFSQSKDLFDHILVNEDLDTVLETIKGHVLAVAEV